MNNTKVNLLMTKTQRIEALQEHFINDPEQLRSIIQKAPTEDSLEFFECVVGILKDCSVTSTETFHNKDPEFQLCDCIYSLTEEYAKNLIEGGRA